MPHQGYMQSTWSILVRASVGEHTQDLLPWLLTSKSSDEKMPLQSQKLRTQFYNFIETNNREIYRAAIHFSNKKPKTLNEEQPNNIKKTP